MTQETPKHYDGSGTIEKQEYLIKMLIERGMESARAFDAATAIKYTDRAGRKDGESDEKDLGKAADYLFRAVFGRWPWDPITFDLSPEARKGVRFEDGETIHFINKEDR